MRGATIEDLYKVEGKAELVGGKIIHLSKAGMMVSRAIGNILFSLSQYADEVGGGHPFSSTVAFVFDLPNRKSFSPDASWYVGKSTGMKFPEGAPRFAVEVRHETDYGDAIENARGEKRRDYFAAGTLVVWDVDLLSDEVIKSYHKDNPDTPAVYKRGDIASAEPAVPGWTMKVDELFE